MKKKTCLNLIIWTLTMESSKKTHFVVFFFSIILIPFFKEFRNTAYG